MTFVNNGLFSLERERIDLFGTLCKERLLRDLHVDDRITYFDSLDGFSSLENRMW